MVETCSLTLYNINKTVVLTCRSVNCRCNKTLDSYSEQVEEAGLRKEERKIEKIIARLNFEIGNKVSLPEPLLCYTNPFYIFMLILFISI